MSACPASGAAAPRRRFLAGLPTDACPHVGYALTASGLASASSRNFKRNALTLVRSKHNLAKASGVCLAPTGHKSGCLKVVVRSRRLELPRVAPQRPQRCASTNSATTARHERAGRNRQAACSKSLPAKQGTPPDSVPIASPIVSRAIASRPTPTATPPHEGERDLLHPRLRHTPMLCSVWRPVRSPSPLWGGVRVGVLRLAEIVVSNAMACFASRQSKARNAPTRRQR